VSTSTAAGERLTRTPGDSRSAEQVATPTTRTGGDRWRWWSGLSLYARVVAVNAAVLAIAAALLATTPVTVSFPLALDEGLILAAGVAVMVIANALLLRGSFMALTGLVLRMQTLDILRPRQRLALQGGRETRTLIEAFNAMLERLEIERRASTRRTLSALEGERRRIGHELHDEIGQRLTGILLQLGRVSAEAPQSLSERLAALQEQARAAIDEVGALAWQLRPAILDDLGLLSALQALVDTLDEQSDVRIGARLPAGLAPIASEIELAIYRITQEALSNALRHAQARTIEVALFIASNGVALVVADDGRGITSREREGAGIRGMRERAMFVGGQLRLESHMGRGVRLRLEIPREHLLG
jgi:two-component system sensor histidine kinase UhpB